jgi:uncharacterized protein YkwD
VFKKTGAAVSLAASLLVVTPGIAHANTLDETRASVISKLNAERLSKCGSAKALKWSDGLTNSAQFHTNDMADHGYVAYNTQTFPQEEWSHRIARISGFNNLVGETVAFGPTSAAKVVAAWMSNTNTKATILDCRMKVVGVGYALRSYSGAYWTADYSDQVVNIS